MTVSELIAELGRHDPQDEVRIFNWLKDADDPDNFYFECYHALPIVKVKRTGITDDRTSKSGVILYKEGDI